MYFGDEEGQLANLQVMQGTRSVSVIYHLPGLFSVYVNFRIGVLLRFLRICAHVNMMFFLFTKMATLRCTLYCPYVVLYVHVGLLNKQVQDKHWQQT